MNKMRITSTLSGFSAACVLVLALPQTGHSQSIFWAENDSGEIRTADWDGTSGGVVADGLAQPVGVAIDAASGHVYYGDNDPDGGNLYRSNLDGTGQETLVSGITNMQMISLDLDGGHVYWGQYETAVGGDGMVQRAELNGDNVELLFDDADRYTALSLDLDNGHVYASDPANGLLHRSNLDGTDLVATEDRFGGWVTNDIAIDGGQMYYSHDPEIRVSDLDGSNEQVLGELDEGYLPLGVAVAPDGNVFFSGRNNADPGNGAIGLYDGDVFTTTFIDAENPFGVAVIPEPSTYALMFALGAGVIVLLRRRMSGK